MILLLLEAVLALGVLVFIVWWTMFDGRTNGELPSDPAAINDASATDKPIQPGITTRDP